MGTHVHGGQRLTTGSSLVSLYLICFRECLSLNLEFTNLARLAGGNSRESSFVYFPSAKVINIHCCTKLFTWMLGKSKLRSSCLHSKHVTKQDSILALTSLCFWFVFCCACCFLVKVLLCSPDCPWAHCAKHAVSNLQWYSSLCLLYLGL